jgi:hypothetical protein
MSPLAREKTGTVKARAHTLDASALTDRRGRELRLDGAKKFCVRDREIKQTKPLFFTLPPLAASF